MKRAKCIPVIPTGEGTSSLNPYIKAHNRSDISKLMLEGKLTQPHMIATGEEVSHDVSIPLLKLCLLGILLHLWQRICIII